MGVHEKTALITGANSGLGFAAAKKFAKSGIKTVMLCRNEQKGKTAMGTIKKEIPGAALDLMIGDLSSIKSVNNFLNKFKAKYAKLDILVNNAAVLKMKPSITEDGFGTMFQTNYLSPVIIMNSLLDVLMKSSSGRIINITAPNDTYQLDFDDLQALKNKKPFDAFMKTKLCLLMYSYKFSRNVKKGQVTVNCTDGSVQNTPGVLIRSNLRRELPAFIRWGLNLLAKSPDTCADSILFLSTAEELKNKTGCIFEGIKERLSVPYWKKDETVIKRLWKETGTYLPVSSGGTRVFPLKAEPGSMTIGRGSL